MTFSLSADWIAASVVAVFGLVALWIIWRLRDQPAQSAPLAPLAQVVPTTAADEGSA